MATERQTAIVTGAASGIGRAMALGLLAGGIDVAAVDREPRWLDELKTAADESRLAGSLHPICADLADPLSFETIVAAVLARSGRIDILVNNAGVGQGSIRADQRHSPIRFWEITPEQWGRFIAVNATAPLMMARAVVPHMLAAGRGRIVTVTTSLGTMLREGYVLYGASKAAAEAATAVIAADLAGTPVTANVLVPGGMTDTRIIPDAAVADRSRLLRPEIMAAPLRWLVSDAAAQVTGRRFLAAHWDNSLPPARSRRKMRRADRLASDRDDADRARLKGHRTMPEHADANAAQQEYWNTVAGPRWVGLEGFVERRVRAVNDLLLRYSAVAAGERVLEIGCGTAAFTMPLADAAGPQGSVLGADISEAMLAGARKRIAESGLRNITLMQADAQTHEFQPAAFDLVASRFGVMFFADPAAAFANLRRAAKPGGRLCFACWGTLEENRHWLIPYAVALHHLGPPAPKSPRAPGPMAFADPDYVRSFLGAAGFEGVEIHREHPEILASTAEEEASHASIMGPTARLIDEKKPDEATRRLIRAEIEAAFASAAASGDMRLPSTVLLVTARQPQP